MRIGLKMYFQTHPVAEIFALLLIDARGTATGKNPHARADLKGFSSPPIHPAFDWAQEGVVNVPTEPCVNLVDKNKQSSIGSKLHRHNFIEAVDNFSGVVQLRNVELYSRQTQGLR